MTALPFTPCLDARGRRKKAYPSEHAAKRELAHSPRWRLRKSWPTVFRCPVCHAYHLGHPEVSK